MSRASQQNKIYNNGARVVGIGKKDTAGGSALRGYKSPITSFLAVAAVASLLYFAVFGKNIFGFFRIGGDLPRSPYIEACDDIIAEAEGYDGQFFLTIALDPLLRNPRSVDALDNPRYRYRRILFPALGYAVSFGRRNAVPYALVGLNVLAFIGAVYTVSKLCEKQGIFSAAPLFLLFVPGLWLSLLLTTADLLGCFFLASAIAAHVDKRYFKVAGWYALAALTHETMLVIIGSLVLSAFLRKKNREAKIISMGILPCVIWNAAVLRIIPPGKSTAGFFENFGIPGAGIAEKLAGIFRPDILRPGNMMNMAAFIMLLASFAVLLMCAARSRHRRTFLPPAMAYSGFFIIARMQILVCYNGFLRVFAGVLVLAILCPVFYKKTPSKPLFLLWGGVSLALVAGFIRGLL